MSVIARPFLDKRLASWIIGLMCPCNGYGKNST